MTFQYWRPAILSIPLLLGSACVSVSNSGNTTDSVPVTVQAQYEKVDYGAAGLGLRTVRPVRYGYAVLRQSSDSSLLAPAADLDANGLCTINVPRGSSFYAVVYADVAIRSGSSLAMRGRVLNAVPAAHYTADAFEGVAPWTVSSDTFLADTAGKVTVQALQSRPEGGAFSIADQMVEFALGMQKIDPTLSMADLNAFWATGTGDANPAAVTDSNGALIKSNYSSRPALAMNLLYATDWKPIAYNDGRLLETFARSLFAYGSNWGTDSQNHPVYGSLVRRDNDNAFVDLGFPSEPSMAFISGYSHFLSCALRNDPHVYDAFVGNATATFRLDQNVGYAPTGGGEFYAGSVARTLWGIWKNVLGGGSTGLTSIWDATNPAKANQPLEFGTSPLACYPTYLKGLRRMNTSIADFTFMTALTPENVGDGIDPISPTYFNGSALWQKVAVPFSGSGTLTTHAASAGIYYDRNQARSYRFTFGGVGTLNVTMTPTSGQDFFLELIGPGGLVASSTQAPSGGAPRSISQPGLTQGEYVVRVRAGYTTSEYNNAGYSLSINVN